MNVVRVKYERKDKHIIFTINGKGVGFIDTAPCDGKYYYGASTTGAVLGGHKSETEAIEAVKSQLLDELKCYGLSATFSKIRSPR